MSFKLHPQLAADTFLVADWPVNRVLLMNDTNFPWLILVPQRENLRDLHEVSASDQGAFWGEINLAARVLKGLTSADKMNVAALGNMVPQLHVHVIARFDGDAAWPGPVWGAVPPMAYEESARQMFVSEFLNATP